MPDYNVVTGSKQRRIELTRTTSSSFSAKVDGKPREIKGPKDGVALEKAFTLDVDGKTYKIEIPKIERENKILVKVDGAVFEVEVNVANRSQALRDLEPTSPVATKKLAPYRKVAAEGAVTAPMTGRIVQVKVNKGDGVKAGQVLCVIEAMKMENEISAPKAGTIRMVNVAVGMPVNEGETLFTIT
jgi:biotin carboxyl carrier protein